jgi:membrane fusion protein, multidrug efflux system
VAGTGGGFGVEVVDGDATRRVPVRTGLFADGRVEITAEGLTEGTTVGMPK